MKYIKFGFIILALSLAYFFIFELPKYNASKIALEKSAQLEEQKRSNNKEAEIQQKKKSLVDCLALAEDKFTDTMKLNSTPHYAADSPYYIDYYTWNDSHIKERTEDNLQRDRELCITLFK